MTVNEATDKLMSYYTAPENWRRHFERIVLQFAGGGNFVSGKMLDDIKQYLRNMT